MFTSNRNFNKNNHMDFNLPFEDQPNHYDRLNDNQRLFSNLLMKSDFTTSEISEIMEWTPSDEQMEEINAYIQQVDKVDEFLNQIQSF